MRSSMKGFAALGMFCAVLGTAIGASQHHIGHVLLGALIFGLNLWNFNRLDTLGE